MVEYIKIPGSRKKNIAKSLGNFTFNFFTTMYTEPLIQNFIQFMKCNEGDKNLDKKRNHPLKNKHFLLQFDLIISNSHSVKFPILKQFCQSRRDNMQ